MFVKIKNIIVLKNFCIKIFFDNGEVRIMDFKPLIQRKGELNKPLADPVFFKKVKIEDGGDSISWPNSLDVCIDYLLYHSSTEKVTA